MSDIIPFVTSTTVGAIIPGDYDSVLEYARLIHASGLAPSTIKTYEAVAVAVLHGMEVGLTPLAALQSIAVINGRPSLWGDGALALCVSNPLCEDFEEAITGEGDEAVATCTIRRKGRAKPIVATFSMQDAIQANLKGKDGPWKQYPKRMLKMRARAFALRDAFPDILRGISIAEEVQDMKDITPQETAPSAPVREKPAPRAVDGEIIPPSSEAAAARQAAAERASAAEAERRDQAEAAERQREQDNLDKAAAKDAEKTAAKAERDAAKAAAKAAEKAAAKEPDPKLEKQDDAGGQPSPFEAYMEKFTAELTTAAETSRDAFNAAWKGRDKTWPEDAQHDQLKAMRDSLKDVVVATDKRLAKEAEEAAGQADEQDEDGDNGDDFSEIGYRATVLEKLKVIMAKPKDSKLMPEIDAMHDEVERFTESGRITKTEYRMYYEDNFGDAIAKHGD
jgi:hypothetical protein